MHIQTGLARLHELAKSPATAPAAELGLHAIEAASRAPEDERVEAVQAVLDHAQAASLPELAALGLEIGNAIHLVGSGEATHAVLEMLQAHPQGAALRLAWSALQNYPTNLMSHTYAVRYALGAPTAQGAALAEVGGKIYHETGMRGDCYTAVPMARKYVDALQGDPDVGTAMWFAQGACENLKGFENLQTYVLDATFAHPRAATGADLSALGLEALEAIPEGCPKPAARLAGSILHGLRGLYSDGESRQIVDDALARVDVAVATSMAFGGGGDVFQDARDTAHAALLKLRSTEDAASRLRRRVEETAAEPQPQAIQSQDDSVVINGVRVSKRR